jgi:hypothetical protein
MVLIYFKYSKMSSFLSKKLDKKIIYLESNTGCGHSKDNIPYFFY